MNVTELNSDQLNVLRQQYHYTINDSTAFVGTDEVPDAALFDFYAGIKFMPEDFSCY